MNFKFVLFSFIILNLNQFIYGMNCSCRLPPVDKIPDHGGNDIAYMIPWNINLAFEKQIFCGGIIINNAWVLTTANCISDLYSLEKLSKLEILVGLMQRNDSNIDEKTFHAKNIILIRAFQETNGLVFIELNKNLTFNKMIKPACLTGENQEYYDDKIAGLHSVGFGSNKGINEIILFDRLKEIYLDDHSRINKNCTDNLICTRSIRPEYKTCIADMAAPLMHRDSNDNAKVVGLLDQNFIHRNNDNQVQCTGESNYLRLSKFIPDIKKAINGDFCTL